MTDQTQEPVAAAGGAGAAVLASAEPPPPKAKKLRAAGEPGTGKWLATMFIGPALVLLAAILLYPLVYSVVRSLFSDGPAGNVGSFTGLRNYGSVFTDESTLRAVKNNIYWVLIVPTVITIVGLAFAVLTERIRWATVFKTVLFMPMAISFLASGVTFALIYADNPSRGLANAVTVGVHDAFESGGGQYPDVHPRGTDFSGSASVGYTTTTQISAGTPALIPLVGLSLTSPPKGLVSAAPPASGPGINGVIWNDFKAGGGGKVGQVDPGELGLKGMKVQAVRDGKVVASATANAQGQFSFPKLTSGSYALKVPASNFSATFGGLSWLGPNLITPAIMVAYLWIYAGFAMVLLAAGMAAIPRDALEAARIDGATEWQVFRRVTVPLLAPVLMVVFVTLVINVLKVFDIVFIISQEAGANGKYADVLATQLFDAYGQQRYGVASAIGVILVLVVLPFMAINIRRFRSEQR
jgi:ABC-type sugar transport system permease subunit